MSEISFIPCELCDELISFEDYTNHISECQRAYRRGSMNRRYLNNYVFARTRVGRPQVLNTPPSDTPPQPPSDTLLSNLNTILNNENNNDISILENYLNRLIRSYNEDEIIFNEEFDRINSIYRINAENENNEVNNNDETDDDMPSLIDYTDEEIEENNANEEIRENINEVIEEDNAHENFNNIYPNIEILSNYFTRIDNMINITNPIYDASIENNTTLEPEQPEQPEQPEVSSTNIPETEQNSVSNLTQNNIIFFNSSNILPNPPLQPPLQPPQQPPQQPPLQPPQLNYPSRRTHSWNNERETQRVSSTYSRRNGLSRYRDYLRTSNLSSINNIGNSYEELTRLGDRIGNVSVGIEKIENICKDYIVKEEEDECFVCREEFVKGDKMKKLLCGHYFCEDCIGGWFKDNKKCPVCMVEFNEDGLIKPKKTQIECEVSTYV